MTEIPQTLVIDNVVYAALERQRKALMNVIHACSNRRTPKADDINVLEGLEGMLTVWSDEQWRAAGCPESDAVDVTDDGDSAEHEFHVVISGCTREQAREVIGARLGHDEETGFDYHIDYTESEP